MTLRTAVGLIFSALAGTGCLAGAVTWEGITGKIHREFPDVPRLTTRELSHWLAARERAKPLLLDVRTEAEFAVSHLAGAQRVDPGARAASLKALKDAPIVTYCSVGYRSAAFAKRLQAAGFTKVRNLEGSVFQWANEGRPLADARGPAVKVHPYNRQWGALLNPPLRADVPDAK